MIPPPTWPESAPVRWVGAHMVWHRLHAAPYLSLCGRPIYCTPAQFTRQRPPVPCRSCCLIAVRRMKAST